jgi:acyl-CoA dehydrogenase
MQLIIWFFVFINFIGLLFYFKCKRELFFTLTVVFSLLSYSLNITGGFITTVTLILLSGIGLIITQNSWRRDLITKIIMEQMKKLMPKISETEQVALKAGTTWWDKDLFSGSPNWESLLKFPKPELTAREQSFLDHEVQTLCEMIDNFEQSEKLNDLPENMWIYLKQNKFFGLIIPKEFNGLGFSALAHSKILSKIAGRSFSVASTVAVPNSLGPAELLIHYGTDAQKSYYLPKLAVGDEIPCFALTSPESGSDATSITDYGIIKKQMHKGREIIGIELSWEKRYITLAPIATVLGLAFRLYDPEGLIGDIEDIGITCALIPTNHSRIQIGKRHKPLTAVFQNGPTSGENVFIPIDWIIGGKNMAGCGWQMLVECLSCGRAISLPSSATGAIKALSVTSGAYAKIRKQFKQPLAKFEGIQAVLAQTVGAAYLSEAASLLTAAAIDAGHKPSVLGAILKYQLTERGRVCALNAMDIHGGKAIMMGKKNYIADHYINTPVAITVEGANILTRNMIIYGQGALRCHPYILTITELLDGPIDDLSIAKFDTVMLKYISSIIKNSFTAFWCALSCSHFLSLKKGLYKSKNIRNIEWASAAFSVLSDACLMIYTSKLKHKEMISARLADCLSTLYLASCCVKRLHDSEHANEEKVLASWCIESLLNEFWQSVAQIIDNLPNLFLKFKLRALLMPFGIPIKAPTDKTTKYLAQVISENSYIRSLVAKDVDLRSHPLVDLEEAFLLTIKTDDLERKLDYGLRSQTPVATYECWVDNNLAAINITLEEANALKDSYHARMKVINVD